MKLLSRENRREVRNLTFSFGWNAMTLCTIQINVGKKVLLSWTFHVAGYGSSIPGGGILGRDNVWDCCVIYSINKTLKVSNGEEWVRSFTLQTVLQDAVTHRK